MSFRCDSRQKKNSDKEYMYKSYYCYFCKAEKTPNNVKEKVILELIKPKLNEFKVQNTVKEERSTNYENIREDIQKEISVLNCNLQIIYEDYKKHSISKEEYLKKKALIQDKKILLGNKLDEFKSDIVNSNKEFNANSLDENSLLKAYVDDSIAKIIVSRTGEIEIVEA